MYRTQIPPINLSRLINIANRESAHLEKCNFMQIIVRNYEAVNDRSSVSNYRRFQLQYQSVWELTTIEKIFVFFVLMMVVVFGCCM